MGIYQASRQWRSEACVTVRENGELQLYVRQRPNRGSDYYILHVMYCLAPLCMSSPPDLIPVHAAGTTDPGTREGTVLR